MTPDLPEKSHGPLLRAAGALMTAEAIYGLIVVSGVLLATGISTGTALHAAIGVAVTVIVFFAAHVYAGALSRLAASEGASGLRSSLASSARRASGMVVASIPALAVLLLGATRVFDADTAIRVALLVNTVILGALGWVSVSRWSTRWPARLLGAVIAAAFGGVLYLVKVVIGH